MEVWWWLDVDSTEIFSVPTSESDISDIVSQQRDLVSDMSQKRDFELLSCVQLKKHKPLINPENGKTICFPSL